MEIQKLTNYKKTITDIFMLPTLNIGKDKLLDNGFINSYSFNSDMNNYYENAVYILFKPSDLNKFRQFLDEEYDKINPPIDDYDIIGGYIVIVYKLDSDFKTDFSLVKEGKYSQTSSAFQALFKKVVHITTPNGLRRDEISLQYRIFQKTPDLVEFWEEKLGMSFNPEYEVWSWFNIEEETLTISKIKEYVE